MHCSSMMLSYGSARLVSGLRDDGRDGVDGCISVNVEALEADPLRELGRGKD